MLTQRLAREGRWLFRHRSVLPLCLLVPLACSLCRFRYVGGSAEWQQAWLWCCFAVSLLGLAVRASIVGCVPEGTSTRSTRRHEAVSLNTTGWYSVTRNPLYLGNGLIGLGFSLTAADPLLLLIYVAVFWLYYERVIASEERFLAKKFGDAYRDWMRRTPVLAPAFRQWQPPELPFSARSVLRREYPAVLVIGATYCMLDLAERAAEEGRCALHPAWTAVLLASIVMFAALRALKHRTGLLTLARR